MEPLDSEEPQNSCLEAHPKGWASSSVHFVGLSCNWERAAREGLAWVFFPSLFSFLSCASSPSFCSPLRRQNLPHQSFQSSPVPQRTRLSKPRAEICPSNSHSLNSILIWTSSTSCSLKVFQGPNPQRHPLARQSWIKDPGSFWQSSHGFRPP